jgi:hypothetical protein
MAGNRGMQKVDRGVEKVVGDARQVAHRQVAHRQVAHRQEGNGGISAR